MKYPFSYVMFEYKAGQDYPVFKRTVTKDEAIEINNSVQDSNRKPYGCKMVIDCSAKELDAIAKLMLNKHEDEISTCFVDGDWTDDDYLYIAGYSPYVRNTCFGASYTFNCDPSTAETQMDNYDILKSVLNDPLKRITSNDFVTEQDKEDYKTNLKRLSINYAKAIWKNSEMVLCFEDDILG